MKPSPQKTIRATILAAAFMAAITITSSQAQVVVYDLQNTLANAQPTLSNPVGAFTFGQYSGGLDPLTFVTFSTFDENLAGSGLDGFYTNPYDPNVLYNDTGATFSGFSMVLPAGEVALGPVLGPSVVRFTAPTAGYYDISTAFARIQTLNAAAFTYVYHNGTQLVANTTSVDTFTYSSTANLLSAGDTIDFVVGGPGSGESTTTLAATVTFTAIPEPSTLAIVCLGATVLFVKRRARAKRTS
jgi:hypothetical protein